MIDTRAEVLIRLDHLRRRVGDLVEHSIRDDASGDHPLRGLYLTSEQAVALAARESELDAGAEGSTGPTPRIGGALAALSRRGGLDAVDIELLVVALAPDLDPRYERLYGYLHDDLTIRRATIGLAMRLCGLELTSAHRRRFGPTSALVLNGLLVVDDDGRPFLGRTLRVPDHVTAHLLGIVAIEQSLQRQTVEPVDVLTEQVSEIRDAIERGEVVHVTEPAGTSAGGTAVHLAAAAAWAAGAQPRIIDISGLDGEELDTTLTAAVRHRTLTGEVLIIRPVEAIAEHARAWLGRLLLPYALDRAAAATVLVGAVPWDRAWSDHGPRHVALTDLDAAELDRIWATALDGVLLEHGAMELARRSFRLTPEQIAATAQTVRTTGKPSIGFTDLSAAAKTHSASGLDQLARRMDPDAGWTDLIVPIDVMDALRELTARVRWHDQVMHQWGLGRGWRNRGIAALFAGPSGTGKTTAAEVIARELGYDMHIVDLSSVVDKYIGETEKRLEVIFTEAEHTNTVLLFDEADSIFGKRSEVKDARDRYANIEVSYLLQRIERFSGLAVLTTNLGANLDEAFTRRLDLVIDFPRPDAAARARLWRHELRPGVPTDDLDIDFCATAFDLTGGNIRNIVITAAYAAAHAGTAVTMTDVVVAVQREYRKMGRLCVPSEFGKYASLLT